MSSNSHDTHAPNKRVKHESPLNHYLSYIISILLTMLAFAVVLYGDLDRSFILIFIVTLALVQAVIQLFFWMHAKERGHLFPLIFIAGGAFVALTGVITAVYWMWW
ncbi:cytochrome C oxidase subunit IV family protein [Paenibacillus sp. GCM10023248]|uniref:cytochrome C oxidase subunit IV family protein n=1 Tax=Bacillales TaxID=1385 RepID=UPI002379033B|nr:MULTISPECIES: cytochrome C oxidase subunit IV family protein [Bacillales]MDD9266781.1 cytochrome C oxidase subunit IV family protein [Paenibacillus sp. MAHUQ-63]MDR6883726.1 cytochrome c oxidase subunit 4 [Bacillus sp. 3255]